MFFSGFWVEMTEGLDIWANNVARFGSLLVVLVLRHLADSFPKALAVSSYKRWHPSRSNTTML